MEGTVGEEAAEGKARERGPKRARDRGKDTGGEERDKVVSQRKTRRGEG